MPCSACGGGSSSTKSYTMKGNIIKQAPIKINTYQQYQLYIAKLRQAQLSHRRAYGLRF